jgi:hypothetical protein
MLWDARVFWRCSSYHYLWVRGRRVIDRLGSAEAVDCCRKIILISARGEGVQRARFSSIEGYPPPPGSRGIITLAGNSRQNTDVKELRGQNPENKGVRGEPTGALVTPRSSTMIAQVFGERKVRRHKEAVEKLTLNSPAFARDWGTICFLPRNGEEICRTLRGRNRATRVTLRGIPPPGGCNAVTRRVWFPQGGSLFQVRGPVGDQSERFRNGLREDRVHDELLAVGGNGIGSAASAHGCGFK